MRIEGLVCGSRDWCVDQETGVWIEGLCVGQ